MGTQPVTCMACESPCATCITTINSCLSCVSGYTLSGTSCISNFKFAAGVVLAVDAATFTANYYQFILAVANAINQHTRTILVKSITYSSADVQMDVSTDFSDGSANANNQQNSLNSLFSLH